VRSMQVTFDACDDPTGRIAQQMQATRTMCLVLSFDGMPLALAVWLLTFNLLWSHFQKNSAAQCESSFGVPPGFLSTPVLQQAP